MFFTPVELEYIRKYAAKKNYNELDFYRTIYITQATSEKNLTYDKAVEEWNNFLIDLVTRPHAFHLQAISQKPYDECYDIARKEVVLNLNPDDLTKTRKLKATWSLEAQQDLMAWKGESIMDSGYFYAPYVPVYQTPEVLDPQILKDEFVEAYKELRSVLLAETMLLTEADRDFLIFFDPQYQPISIKEFDDLLEMAREIKECYEVMQQYKDYEISAGNVAAWCLGQETPKQWVNLQEWVNSSGITIKSIGLDTKNG
jgi:hypothetical protein